MLKSIRQTDVHIKEFVSSIVFCIWLYLVFLSLVYFKLYQEILEAKPSKMMKILRLLHFIFMSLNNITGIPVTKFFIPRSVSSAYTVDVRDSLLKRIITNHQKND